MFVLKKNLPAGGGQVGALAKVLDRWAQEHRHPARLSHAVSLLAPFEGLRGKLIALRRHKIHLAEERAIWIVEATLHPRSSYSLDDRTEATGAVRGAEAGPGAVCRRAG